jgi:hypothetical protein
MGRRHFVQLLLSALAVPYAEEKSKPAPPPSTETIPPITQRGTCRHPDKVWDGVLDIHICPNCGAHETAKGWQAR